MHFQVVLYAHDCSWNTYLVWRLNVEINRRYKTFVSTLHCVLENGADLYINECQNIRNYCARSLKKEEERRRMPNRVFF